MSDVSEETDSRKMEEGKVTRGEGCCVPVTKKKVQVVNKGTLLEVWEGGNIMSAVWDRQSLRSL